MIIQAWRADKCWKFTHAKHCRKENVAENGFR